MLKRVWDWLGNLGTSVLGCPWLCHSGQSGGQPPGQHDESPLHEADQVDIKGISRIPRYYR